MKEATGELNMTVIVVSSVAILSAFFYTVIFPNIHSNFKQQTSCNRAICESKPNKAGFVNCTIRETNEPIVCKYKG